MPLLWKPLPFGLPGCVEEVVDMLSPVAHEKRIELVMVLDPRLPQQVRGDSVPLASGTG